MKMRRSNSQLDSSFRDPSGFLFLHNGALYRQINRVYAEIYNRLMDSGLYGRLVKAGLLIPHSEAEVESAEPSLAFKVIQPEHVPFISYPYEWSFSQLKDAALATLSIQKRALKAGMSLKDASAYNIQFVHGKATLIDTLSFEIYREGEPWVAYRQFCQHFLAPLALMSQRDVRLSQLLRVYIDGVPLNLASALLPFRTRWNFGLASHIHIHARAQQKFADKTIRKPRPGTGMTQQAMLGLIASLDATIRKLEWKPVGTEWADKYDITNYTSTAFEHKKQWILEWLGRIRPGVIWDLGANTGVFSRLAAEKGAYTVAFDIDPAAVEVNYRQVRSNKELNLLPLVQDLTNPSPALGWANSERESLGGRGPADVILSLALIHHLAISNNVPLLKAAEIFAGMCNWLVIEFVPKSDSQVQKLLRSRDDIFDHYTREDFEQTFSSWFEIHQKVAVSESERWLYLMKRRPG